MGELIHFPPRPRPPRGNAEEARAIVAAYDACFSTERAFREALHRRDFPTAERLLVALSDYSPECTDVAPHLYCNGLISEMFCTLREAMITCRSAQS